MTAGGGEVIGQSFVELLPRATNFGRDAAAQIRRQMSGAAGAVAQSNKGILDQQARLRDAQGRFAKQGADEQIKQSRRSSREIQRESSRTVAGVSKNFNGLRVGIFKSFSGLQGVVAGAFAGLAAGKFIKDSITAASDLNETVSKTGVIFGAQTPEILKFAETAATAIGSSKQQALDAAANFAIFGKSAGLTGPKLTKFSTSLVQLTGDMASFSNTTPQEAIDAVGAALRGETEPIRRYGVLIDDASTRQEALRLGIVKTTKDALTPQQRVLAVQSLIMKQTSVAQGDFARTSSGLANQQRILSAQFQNFKSSIGQVALPLVVRLFTFLNTTGIPFLKKGQYAVEAFAAAFSGEGITSNGFIGFMERVGVVARVVFDFFRSTVVPILQRFGQILIGVVVPYVVRLAVAFGQQFLPVLRLVGNFITGTVLPAVQNLGKWIASQLNPVFQLMAGHVKQIAEFLAPFAGTLLVIAAGIKIVALATRAWAIATGILNAVLAINPITLVIIGIAALVAIIVVAYKHSETFRNILTATWNGIKAAAQAAWPVIKAAVEVIIAVFQLWWRVVSPIFKLFLGELKLVWIAVQFMGRIVVTTFNALKGPIVSVLVFLTRIFLDWVGGLVTGAAKALGWVPGVGPKLKKAAAAFNTFKDQTNTALSKLKDQTINVTPHLKNVTYTVAGVVHSTPINTIGSAGRGMAYGGPVRGPGTTTSDSVPTNLSTGEHVWSAAEVAAAGGHAVMMQMRANARAGRLGLASGGTTAVNIQPHSPSARGTGAWASEVAAHAKAAAAPAAAAAAAAAYQQLAATLGGGPTSPGGPNIPPGAVRSFRGVRLNTRTIGMLLQAERILGAVFHIMQGSYSTRVAASGSTHAGGGAMDTDGPRGWNAAVAALRRVGFASWHRTPAQGPWGHHIHSIARGDPTASPAAKRQVADFLRGGAGLARGAWKILRNQLQLVHKGEMVVPSNEADELRRLFGAGQGGGAYRRPPGSAGSGDGYWRLHPDDRRLLEDLASRPIELDGTRLDYAMSNEATRRYR